MRKSAAVVSFIVTKNSPVRHATLCELGRKTTTVCHIAKITPDILAANTNLSDIRSANDGRNTLIKQNITMTKLPARIDVKRMADGIYNEDAAN
jgi:hypothetical protein